MKQTYVLPMKAIASLEEHIQPADPGLEEANQRVLELEEENEHLKTEVEKLNVRHSQLLCALAKGYRYYYIGKFL